MSVLEKEYSTISGEDREKDPPVHIPNTAVKLLIADSTALVTRWKSRTLPDSIKDYQRVVLFFHAQGLIAF